MAKPVKLGKDGKPVDTKSGSASTMMNWLKKEKKEDDEDEDKEEKKRGGEEGSPRIKKERKE